MNHPTSSLSKEELILKLRAIEEFRTVKEETLLWLIKESSEYHYSEGDTLFQPGEAVDEMLIMVSGAIAFYRIQNNEMIAAGTIDAPAISGVLPFSRMTHATGLGKAVKESVIFKLNKKHFTEMVNRSYPMVQALVSNMLDRTRNFTQNQVQTEKLMALGKLSAGLAHELNNPASSVKRAASSLIDKLEGFKAKIYESLPENKRDQVRQVMENSFQCTFEARSSLSLLEQEEIRDDWWDWLDEIGIDNAEDLADVFTDEEVRVDDLKPLEDILEEGELTFFITRWHEQLELSSLLKDITDGAERISDLVGSIKSFSHMDQGFDQSKVRLEDLINNTLRMLQHKLKQKDIQVIKSFEPALPEISLNVGAINQVWTNIIDNAIDAMEKEGQLRISIYRKNDCCIVDIQDNGQGMPEDVKRRVFEPFYTTKKVGEGTGMGLDISKRIIDQHKGNIQVLSEPGKGTTFSIDLPIEN
jgi:signal transduction histidine kinase